MERNLKKIKRNDLEMIDPHFGSPSRIKLLSAEIPSWFPGPSGVLRGSISKARRCVPVPPQRTARNRTPHRRAASQTTRLRAPVGGTKPRRRRKSSRGKKRAVHERNSAHEVEADGVSAVTAARGAPASEERAPHHFARRAPAARRDVAAAHGCPAGGGMKYGRPGWRHTWSASVWANDG